MTDVSQMRHSRVVLDLKIEEEEEDLDQIKLIVVCLVPFQRRELEESRQELEEERRRLLQQREVALSPQFELFRPKHRINLKIIDCFHVMSSLSKIQNLRYNKVFILIRHTRRHIYICLLFYSSIACFVWKPVHDTRVRSSLLKNGYKSHDFELFKAVGKLLM